MLGLNRYSRYHTNNRLGATMTRTQNWLIALLFTATLVSIGVFATLYQRQTAANQIASNQVAVPSPTLSNADVQNTALQKK